MTKTEFIRARIEPKLKEEAENILHKLGITTTQALTMFYEAIAKEKRLPLEMKIPNAETNRVFDETDNGIRVISCKNKNDFYTKLGIKRKIG